MKIMSWKCRLAQKKSSHRRICGTKPWVTWNIDYFLHYLYFTFLASLILSEMVVCFMLHFRADYAFVTVEILSTVLWHFRLCIPCVTASLQYHVKIALVYRTEYKCNIIIYGYCIDCAADIGRLLWQISVKYGFQDDLIFYYDLFKMLCLYDFLHYSLMRVKDGCTECSALCLMMKIATELKASVIFVFHVV